MPVDRIINFISNHFEIIVTINCLFVVLFVTMAILLRMRDITRDHLRIFKEKILFYGIVVLQTSLIIILGYVYWMNYYKRNQLSLYEVLLPSTLWVRAPTTIFYIVGNVLFSIDPRGHNKKTIYEADSNIKEYQFSPNGKNTIIITEKDIVLINLDHSEKKVIDSIQLPGSDIDFKGSIGNVHWSLDSQKFTYSISRWSSFSSQDKTYVYFLNSKEKKPIESPTRKIPRLYWSQDNESLYYFLHTALDPQEHGYPYDVRIYQVPLSGLIPQMVAEVSSDTSEIAPNVLRLRGIHLFTEGDKLNFGLAKKADLVWVSEAGSKIGIDIEDYLYYVPNQWWRKRLFYVHRDPIKGDIPYYQHQGVLQIRHLEWLPDDRYVIISHAVLGTLILEPATGKIGRLVESAGYGFGWYKKPTTVEIK